MDRPLSLDEAKAQFLCALEEPGQAAKSAIREAPLWTVLTAVMSGLVLAVLPRNQRWLAGLLTLLPNVIEGLGLGKAQQEQPAATCEEVEARIEEKRRQRELRQAVNETHQARRERRERAVQEGRRRREIESLRCEARELRRKIRQQRRAAR